MNNEITIVSAMFSIERSNWKGFKRSDEQYFSYFTSWAKLKNNMMVYVESKELKEKVLAFRDSLGLKDRTTVILVDNIFELEPELYSTIKDVAENPITRKHRFRPNNPESYIASYNYVMILKAWCLMDAQKNRKISGKLAWMDFGFNHGGQVYSLKSDFNFLWEYPFEDKITMFNLQKLDDRPIFDVVLSMDTYIMGSIIVVPEKYCGILWELARKCTNDLAECGLTDDDQTIWLMCYRAQPDIFDIKYTEGWHRTLKEYGANHLIVNTKSRRKADKLYDELRKVRRVLEVAQYAIRQFKIAIKWSQK